MQQPGLTFAEVTEALRIHATAPTDVETDADGLDAWLAALPDADGEKLVRLAEAVGDKYMGRPGAWRNSPLVRMAEGGLTAPKAPPGLSAEFSAAFSMFGDFLREQDAARRGAPKVYGLVRAATLYLSTFQPDVVRALMIAQQVGNEA